MNLFNFNIRAKLLCYQLDYGLFCIRPCFVCDILNNNKNLGTVNFDNRAVTL